jgi:hypothetical protein
MNLSSQNRCQQRKTRTRPKRTARSGKIVWGKYYKQFQKDLFVLMKVKGRKGYYACRIKSSKDFDIMASHQKKGRPWQRD